MLVAKKNTEASVQCEFYRRQHSSSDFTPVVIRLEVWVASVRGEEVRSHTRLDESQYK